MASIHPSARDTNLPDIAGRPSRGLGLRKLLTLLALAGFLTLGIASASAAEEPKAEVSRSQPSKPGATSSPFASKELAPLAGYLGNWEIEGAWADGTPLWSRNEFTVGLGGNFVVARTFTKNEAGEIYQRYTTYFGADKTSGNLVSHGFTYDGSMAVVDPMEVGGEPGLESLTSQFTSGGPTVRQTVQLTSRSSYTWKVWIQTGQDPWQQVMDGVWHRVD